MDLTPKQQTSEAVRQAETILIATAQHPSVDQATAVMALALVLRKFGKKVSAVMSDSVPNSLDFLANDMIDKSLNGSREFIVKLDLSHGAEPDNVKYTVSDGKLNLHVTPFKGGWTAADVTFAHGVPRFDVAIVLGVPTKARLDRVFSDNAGLFDSMPVVNIDFHRSNESYGAVNLIEPTASSLSEILVALAESLQNGLIDEQIATILLTGIMASTDRFTASHTTSKSLTVAAQLMAAGAKQPMIVKALYHRDQKSGGRDGSRDGRSSERSGRQSGSGSRPASMPRNDTPLKTETSAKIAPSNPETTTKAPEPKLSQESSASNSQSLPDAALSPVSSEFNLTQSPQAGAEII